MDDLKFKWIIEYDKDGFFLVLAKCKFHKDLSENIENVLGGGEWSWNRDTSIIELYGKSDDFGIANFVDVQIAILDKRVYNSKFKTKNPKFTNATFVNCLNNI